MTKKNHTPHTHTTCRIFTSREEKVSIRKAASLPRGDGQLGLHLERDELIRWFEHMDHVLQHTRVPAEELRHRHPPTPDYGDSGRGGVVVQGCVRFLTSSLL